jgi:hypothetical protein
MWSSAYGSTHNSGERGPWFDSTPKPRTAFLEALISLLSDNRHFLREGPYCFQETNAYLFSALSAPAKINLNDFPIKFSNSNNMQVIVGCFLGNNFVSLLRFITKKYFKYYLNTILYIAF